MIKETLLLYPDVERVSAVSNMPGGRINNNPLSYDKYPETVETSEISVDFGFIETLGLHIVEGRDFSVQFGSDSISKFILNETAVREPALRKSDNLFTFEYFLLADQFDEQYRNENKMGTIYWMMAVTYQSIRASMMKPVDSLRYE